MYRRYIKRLLDIILALIGLILLSPVFLILTILVRGKLGSPVFFHQDRTGKDGKIFGILKFRSMRSVCRISARCCGQPAWMSCRNSSIF